MRRKPKRNNTENSFRLSDEARANIYNEYAAFGEEEEDFDEAEPFDEVAFDDEEVFGEEEDLGEESSFDEDEESFDDEEETFDDEQPDADEEQFAAAERPKKHILRKLMIFFFVLALLVIIVDMAILVFSGEIWFNRPDRHVYPNRGVGLTEDAGRVDWITFARQDIQFCYIRATKGDVYEDERYRQNRAGSSKTAMPVGMVHMFDPELSGEEQAQHYINVCGDLSGKLRPVVDCRFSGFYRLVSPDNKKLLPELRAFCDRISEEYGCTPIIKCGESFYKNASLENGFEDCPVWIVSEFSKPDAGIKHVIWSYSPRARFNHYGKRKYLEIAVLDRDLKVEDFII